MCVRRKSNLSSSSSALSNFCASRSCFTGAVSLSQTYFSLPDSLSRQRATHIDSGCQTTSAQPLSTGGASGLRLRVTSHFLAPSFQRPLSGCCPRPIKMPLGSTTYAANSTRRPLTIAYPCRAFSASRRALPSALKAFRSSLVLLALASRSASTNAFASEKSTSFNAMAGSTPNSALKPRRKLAPNVGS